MNLNSVSGGMEVTVEYREPDKHVSISAERLRTGAIGLFMDWAQFPEGSTTEEQRSIFERVVHALWFLEIPIGDTEIDRFQNKWPLPPRPGR